MRNNRIQETIINKLLDKYEKSKTFQGTNQVCQKFSLRIAELFPKYGDHAEYDYFCDVNEAVSELERKDLISVSFQRMDIINTVELNVQQLEQCYAFVNREPKKDEQKWVIDKIEQFCECPILNSYKDAQNYKIAKNQKVEYYDGNKEEFENLLKLVALLYDNQEEQFIRDFSIRHFGDSKKVEGLAGKARALMHQYGDFQDKDSVLEECNVLKTPTYVFMKGNGRLTLGGQVVELSRLIGDIGLSTDSLRELQKVDVCGRRVITVENLTSFHDYNMKDDFVIYLGGFHNTAKRHFLKELYEQNREKEYLHFGDIDAGGFYILEHLKVKTGIPFRSMNMNVAVLERYRHYWKTLTANDKKRLESLQNKLPEEDRAVIAYMLKNNCKLEQEAIDAF